MTRRSPSTHRIVRWLRRPHLDGGYSAEAVVVTALLVAAAILVVGIIVAKVTALANGILL